jgi:hypothetical protein
MLDDIVERARQGAHVAGVATRPAAGAHL